MQEHAHLDSWLRLVEEAASRLDSAHVTYVTAKEELGKFEVSPVSPREPDSQSRPPFCRFIPSLNWPCLVRRKIKVCVCVFYVPIFGQNASVRPSHVRRECWSRCWGQADRNTAAARKVWGRHNLCVNRLSSRRKSQSLSERQRRRVRVPGSSFLRSGRRSLALTFITFSNLIIKSHNRLF